MEQVTAEKAAAPTLPEKEVEGAPVVAPQREKTSVEREADLLTPTPYEPGTALYRQVLPGILQVPADAVLAGAKAYAPDARIEGISIQSMARGTEIILGAVNDPHFGPYVLVGLGGVLTEILHDVSRRFAPIDTAAAQAMIAELKGAPVLRGFRGAAACDLDALAGDDGPRSAGLGTYCVLRIRRRRIVGLAEAAQAGCAIWADVATRPAVTRILRQVGAVTATVRLAGIAHAALPAVAVGRRLGADVAAGAAIVGV